MDLKQLKDIGGDIVHDGQEGYDLNTAYGCYRYICKHLAEKGSSSRYFSCLEELFKLAQEGIDAKEKLEEVRSASAAAYASAADRKRWRIAQADKLLELLKEA